MANIVVTWTDNQQATLSCEKWEIADGLLWLTSETGAQPAHCIPLCNVRVWTVT